MADEVQRALGRIEGKLDAIEEKIDGQNVRLNNHSNRISKLERWQSWTLGAAAAAGVALSALWQLIHGK